MAISLVNGRTYETMDGSRQEKPDVYRTLHELHQRPRPFLLYTETVIYRVRHIERLEAPSETVIPSVTVACEERGTQELPLDAVKSIVVQDGFAA